MIDFNDDLGTARRPFRVAACIAVHGRLPLLEQTIKRLYKKNHVDVVICAGDGMHERTLCQQLKAVWVHARNKPLGNKWNQAFFKAREFNVDAVLFVGSSDWLSDDWIYVMQPHLEKHHNVGTLGCYLLDIGREENRAVYWPGYTNSRRGENIGIGRMLSKELMNKIDWLPFDPALDNSLDRSMTDKTLKLGYKEFNVDDERLKSLSLSTYQWANKHQFAMHWANILPSERINDVNGFIDLYFPEVHRVFKKETI